MFRDAERYTTHKKGTVGVDFIITKRFGYKENG
jgi:hypothetical protein